ncbi:Asp-tRNA(Asn)/Glu-tRNA(Gln) amidotransferase subunit GatC [Patescibacteria group bacterium]|nr:Asp-tRNA(Asn)/Glu-tRNA(Gln) amidotransferase subunit GatC [Patescibacteria group bacterium]
MLSHDQVGHIAKLARIGLSEEEKNRFAKDLSAILDFIEKLKEVDVDKTEPTAQVTGLHSVARPDEGIKRGAAGRQKILSNVPDRKENYIKVKGIFD